MSKSPKYFLFIRDFLIILIGSGILFGFSSILELKSSKTGAKVGILEKPLVIIQGNSLLPISNPRNPESLAIQKLRVVITAYSSTIWQTDSSPYITAAGTRVKEGIVANNILPFGTKIRIPELYGNKVFVVEDRMSWKKGNYHIDIWFSSYQEAKNFGAKRTYIEVLEN